MRRSLLLLPLLLLLLPCRIAAAEETPTPTPEATVDPSTQELIDAMLDGIDLGDADSKAASEGLPFSLLPSTLLDSLLQGSFEEDTLLTLLKSLVGEALPSAGALMILLAGFALIELIQQSLSTGGTADMAGLMLRALCGLAALTLLWPRVNEARGCLVSLSELVSLLEPLIVALLTLFGMSGSALVFRPALTLLSGAVSTLMYQAVLPLALAGGVIGVMELLAPQGRGGVGALLLRICRWILVTVCSLYLTLTALKGFSAGASDSLLLRTTRLAASGLPFVGGLISDSLETAFSCMRLVKGALGVTGILLCVTTLAGPLIRLGLQLVVLKAAGAVARPLGAEGVGQLCERLGAMLGVLLAAILTVLAMLTGCLGLVIGLN